MIEVRHLAADRVSVQAQSHPGFRRLGMGRLMLGSQTTVPARVFSQFICSPCSFSRVAGYGPSFSRMPLRILSCPKRVNPKTP